MRLGDQLDQHSLDRLRSLLGLKPSGRLGDDWDELFGEVKRPAADGVMVSIELWRDVDTAEWRVDVETTSAVSEEAASKIADEVGSAVEAAGLTISSVLRRS